MKTYLKALLLIFLSASYSPAWARSIVVMKTGRDSSNCGENFIRNPCQTITYALSKANPDDYISVGPGIYGDDANGNGILHEPGEEPSSGDNAVITINKSVTILALSGYKYTIITGTNPNFPIIKIVVSNVKIGLYWGQIFGFTLRNTSPLEAIKKAGAGLSLAHGVKNVQVGGCLSESNGFGFDIGFSSGGGSESVYLNGNIARNNAIGFYLDGLRNTIINSKADSNITAGFVVDGEGHIASGNTANKQKYGFSIAGASHRLTSNSATNSFGESDSAGFSVNGIGSLFTANITENNLYGFDVYGENHIFRNNRVANNQIRGFEIRGKGHSIRLNAIRNNFEAGINIPDADNASLDITTNNIFGNGNEEYGQYCGIINEDTGVGVTVLAPNNYWGSASGPDLGPLPVNGVCGNVNPNPFATMAFNLRSGRFIP